MGKYSHFPCVLIVKDFIELCNETVSWQGQVLIASPEDDRLCSHVDALTNVGNVWIEGTSSTTKTV